MRKFTLLICLFLVQFTFAQRKGYWQQKVDYKMTIDIKDDLYQYDGKMKLKYTNNSGQSLNKVYFHLYFNAFQPKSMMDYRLANIADPDKRMVDNIGTKENPKMQSRIATLGKDNIGYQKISSLTQNGKATSYKIDGTILEVTLATPIKAGKSATFDMVWEAQVPEQIRRSGRNFNTKILDFGDEEKDKSIYPDMYFFYNKTQNTDPSYGTIDKPLPILHLRSADPALRSMRQNNKDSDSAYLKEKYTENVKLYLEYFIEKEDFKKLFPDS